MSSENKFKKARNAYCRNALKSGLGRLKGCFFYDASQRKKNKEIEDMEEEKYSYDDEIRITSEFLDKIDILQYAEKHMKLYQLMEKVEDNNPAPDDDFFEGCLFNRMSVYEFEDYLRDRYKEKIYTYDVSTTYIDLNED